ncbi:type VI secretion system lipoprotein TssJ [Serratia fonticola]|uniref:type VI secretion system lipoprotein TssJ n=1 Tax=Serratia fonticola TaxID=47917 RepID=UPI0015C59902|nr:type VI secretion system lipoprotein TssJ [Serratia fonticola]MBC3378250.1 type VI secretion system lipoprotein TssJ [Serratia fonticola]NYA37450.1 type VI secretion system lipoprotein TssJ [Serratia fonticola]
MKGGRGYFLTTALCLVLMLSGCTIWKNKKPERATEQPSTLRLTLLADANINPNEKGEAAPTEIAVVYLSDDSKLLAADYDQLDTEILKKTLSKNYIDHQEYTLLPSQYKPLPAIELEEKTHYLGVIAYYADVDRAEWKKIIKINDVGHNYGVLIHVKADEIDLRKEEE